jgi:hypothetical protein
VRTLMARSQWSWVKKLLDLEDRLLVKLVEAEMRARKQWRPNVRYRPVPALRTTLRFLLVFVVVAVAAWALPPATRRLAYLMLFFAPAMGVLWILYQENKGPKR